MKKILFVIGSANIGGAETGLMEILNELNNDYEIDVCFYNKIGPLLERLPSNVNIYEICNPSKTRIYKKFIQYLYYRGSKLLYRMIIKKRYDVEIAFIEGAPALFISNSFNTKSKKIASIRVDLTEHKMDVENRVKDPVKAMRILGCAYSKIDIVFGVSKTTTESFRKKFPNYSGKLLTLNTYFDKEKYMTLAKESFSYPQKEVFHIISVGRCFEQKGYDRLVCIAKKLKDNNKHFLWHIVGRDNNEYAVELKKKIKSYDLDDNIIFEGEVINPYKFIYNSNLLVSTSYYEGYPRVVNEAIAVEIPVVAPDISGVKESIDDKYGLCTKDDTESIYEGILKLMDNKKLYNKIKDNLANKKYNKKAYYDELKKMINL